jgi:hypothetical protein
MGGHKFSSPEPIYPQTQICSHGSKRRWVRCYGNAYWQERCVTMRCISNGIGSGRWTWFSGLSDKTLQLQVQFEIWSLRRSLPDGLYQRRRQQWRHASVVRWCLHKNWVVIAAFGQFTASIQVASAPCISHYGPWWPRPSVPSCWRGQPQPPFVCRRSIASHERCQVRILLSLIWSRHWARYTGVPAHREDCGPQGRPGYLWRSWWCQAIDWCRHDARFGLSQRHQPTVM